MNNDISAHSTDDLLRMLEDKAGDAAEFIYEAEQCLFKRWHQGIDLTCLVNLLGSENTETRLRGAYYLREAVPPADSMTETVMTLANDPLSYCRRAFVGYITNSGLYAERIAEALAAGLFDFDLNVRVATIYWAIVATDDRFSEFSRLVEAATGVRETEFWREAELKRGIRGLSIARRLRAGETVEEVKKRTPEEDSFTFDYLQFFKKRIIRNRERLV